MKNDAVTPKLTKVTRSTCSDSFPKEIRRKVFNMHKMNLTLNRLIVGLKIVSDIIYSRPTLWKVLRVQSVKLYNACRGFTLPITCDAVFPDQISKRSQNKRDPN